MTGVRPEERLLRRCRFWIRDFELRVRPRMSHIDMMENCSALRRAHGPLFIRPSCCRLLVHETRKGKGQTMPSITKQKAEAEGVGETKEQARPEGLSKCEHVCYLVSEVAMECLF